MKRLFALSLLYLPATYGAMQCAVDDLAKYTWNEALTGEQVVVEADNAAASEAVVAFRGNVIAKRGQEIFYGNYITYKRDTRDIHAADRFIYGAPNFAIRAEKGDYSLNDSMGAFYGLEYFLGENGATGTADFLDVDRKTGIENMTNATYSTCPRESRAWEIQAEEVKLDHVNGIGETWDATFHIAGLPIFYVPYFTFPLDNRRKTGFLWPQASLSESRGVDITVPYYINISSNMDATLYPRFMHKRGFMPGAEYRYLTEDWKGSVSGTYMFDDWKYDGKRWSFSTEHEYRPSDNFFVAGKYQRVSDTEYIDDFKKNLDLDNDNFLESYIKGVYSFSPNYRLTGELTSYQVADNDYTKKQRPYAILPRVTGIGEWRLDNGINLYSETQVTNFYKEKTVSGIRADQQLTADYTLERDYGYIKPEATYRVSQYRLRDQGQGVDSMHTRAIPTFSLDASLFLDRQMSWFGTPVTQSLEPRLYYLYTPYDDQSELPNFDTSTVGSSYSAMFRDNRFTGGDRIGDANQLTTSITSTFTENETGKEIAKLSVGQIQYFQDREVSLSNQIDDTSRSDVIAEGNMQLFEDVSLRGLMHYDTDESQTEKSNIGVIYSPDSDKSISVAHLYDRDNYEQVDFSGVWRIDDNWRTFWRWHYSVEYEKTVDTFAGVEYADCCWGLRLIAGRKRKSVHEDDELETSVHLEFSLNGLGNVGSNTNKMLKEVIPNYRPISYEKPQ